MRERDEKESQTCSEALADSEASPSARLGLIVPWCDDSGNVSRDATVLVLHPRDISVILKEPAVRCRLLPCK